MSLRPCLLIATDSGHIRPEPSLLMLRARGSEWAPPDPSELTPLPPESELFLLPGRKAAGLSPATGKMVQSPGLAVAAFAAPAWTLSGHPAYFAAENAPMLPLFAYGAAGYARGRVWVCATKVDNDQRQQFANVRPNAIARNCQKLLAKYPENRLVAHIINNCALRYDCPAARNFALGRHEAPLPTSRACNARCLGCISAQDADSPIKETPQCRLEFTPTASEIVEVMHIHEAREKTAPIYSFGQGCEGDPLMNAELLAESIAIFRAEGGGGTINCNTNASRPEAVALLADAGLTSMRVSLNSARPGLYDAYYRPRNYNFNHVRQSIRAARAKNIHVALNLLFFPGITDTPGELEALSTLCAQDGVAMIQWRNLNIDPQWHFEFMAKIQKKDKPLGLATFMAELKRRCPWLRYGYFNPWLGDRAEISAPMPG